MDRKIMVSESLAFAILFAGRSYQEASDASGINVKTLIKIYKNKKAGYRRTPPAKR